MNHTRTKKTIVGCHQLNRLKCVVGIAMLYGAALQAQFYCTNNLSQNLVPNPGFEYYSSCPDNSSELTLATPWFIPTGGTSDYFNSCATSPYHVGVPVNWPGTQTPHGGSAYGGGIQYYAPNPNFREYLETPLLVPLTSGHTYLVSFYACIADSSSFALDNLGAYLSVGQLLNPTSDLTLSITPQVRNPAGNFLSSLHTWVLIQGTFTAAGNEFFLTIGNFYDDQNSPTVPVPGGSENYSYYYIDDVSVVDTTPCINTCTAGCITISNPNDIVVTTCSNSMTVNYVVGVVDTCCNGCVTLVSDPPTGYNFPLGTTTVSNTATDTFGNSNSCSFTVTVIPNTNSPVITVCPTNIVVCLSSNGCGYLPDVTSQVQATGLTSGSVVILQSIPPGTPIYNDTNITFAIANASGCGNAITRTVPCLLTDCSGSNRCFQVDWPTNIVVVSCTNIPVFYQPTVFDCCSNHDFVCSPTNGSWFSPGTTNTVLCAVTDTCGNSNGCSFTVTVNPCPSALAATWDHNNLNLNWANVGYYNWHLQNSTDLLHWTTFLDVTNLIPPIVISNVQNIQTPAQYYRLFRTN